MLPVHTFFTFHVLERAFNLYLMSKFKIGLQRLHFHDVALFTAKFGCKLNVPCAGFKKFYPSVSNLAGDVLDTIFTFP